MVHLLEIIKNYIILLYDIITVNKTISFVILLNNHSILISHTQWRI